MLRILHDTSFDFIKWWRTAAFVTIAFMAMGLASFLFQGGINYSIEFTGGTMLQLEFAQPPNVNELRATVDAVSPGAEIQQFGSEQEFTIRAQNRSEGGAEEASPDAVASRVKAALETKYGKAGFTEVRRDAVTPKVGEELSRGALIAMFLASLVTLCYLAIRFEWRFGVAAVLSTAHDVLITLAFIKLMHLEVSLAVVAAILTLLGYSGNDTIIIFDRVRENLKKVKKEPLYDLLNRSINETLPRSVLTHATTLTATLSLLIFAGEVIRPFAWVMTFGIFVATFSSIYVASPLLLWIERKFPREVADKAHSSAKSARAESLVDPDAPGGSGKRGRPSPSPRSATTR